MPIRVGVVSYLNARPLIAGLSGRSDLELVEDTPARLSDALRRGELELGLLPLVEAARQDLVVLPRIAIAARRDVRSVLLLWRGEIGQIRRLALDLASRTSVALARLLLLRELGLRPAELVPDPSHPLLPEEADAAVVIGDRALALEPGPWQVRDLAGWWIAHSGLPCVFAVWAGRDAALLRSLQGPLLEARERGLGQLAEIARREGPARRIDEKRALAYLRESIHFELGEEELRGARRFLAELIEAGLLEPGARLRIADPAQPR